MLRYYYPVWRSSKRAENLYENKQSSFRSALEVELCSTVSL